MITFVTITLRIENSEKMKSDNKGERILKYFESLKSVCINDNRNIRENIDNIRLSPNAFLYIHDFAQAKIINIRGIQNVLGWDLGELSTRELYEIIHEDDRFLVYDITRYTIETILQKKIEFKPFDDILCLNYRMLTSNKQFKMISRESTIIERSENNIPSKALSICTDITYLNSPPIVNFYSIGAYHDFIHYEDYISKNKTKHTDVFTIREAEVLSLLAQGLTNKKISDILFISENTVHKHIFNMKEKTRTKNTPELIKYAIFKGVINARDN